MEKKFRRRLCTSSVKREIRHFHVLVVQWRQRNVQKAWCTCKIVVLGIKPIASLTSSLPSPSSDLKTYSGLLHCLESTIIECFHSRDQHLCKFIGTKESVCIRKELNSQRIGLGHQHGGRFIVLGHQYGHRDVMWKHSIMCSGAC